MLDGIWNGLRTAALLAGMLLSFTLLGAHPGQADELDAVLRSGRIRIATDLGVPPFGQLGADGEPAGLDIDLGRKLARDLGVTYAHVPVTGQNRVPYLQTNQADLVISSFTLTAERAKAVAFSMPYVDVPGVIVAPGAVKLAEPADLASVTVGLARGTTHEQFLRRYNVPLKVVRFDDDAAAQAALITRQVDAFGTNAGVAAMLQQRYPDRAYTIRFTAQDAFYAIGANRTSTDLMRWVNAWLFLSRYDGSLEEIRARWLGPEIGKLPAGMR